MTNPIMSGDRREARIKDALITKGWNDAAARAFAKSEGRCEYCRRDILIDRLAYGCSVSDHLLPKGKHPDFADDPDNHVASCGLCNSVKHDYDPSEQDDSHSKPDLSKRDVYIRRSRDRIVRRMRDYDKDWIQVKRAFFPDG